MSKYLVTALFAIAINLSAIDPVSADHYKTACTSANAYRYIVNTLYGEKARYAGKPTKVKDLGTCYPLRRGTIVEIKYGPYGFACVTSKSWQGCRYMNLNFFTRATAKSTGSWRKLKGKKTYQYLGK